jgi:hypothetical protein
MKRSFLGMNVSTLKNYGRIRYVPEEFKKADESLGTAGKVGIVQPWAGWKPDLEKGVSQTKVLRPASVAMIGGESDP